MNVEQSKVIRNIPNKNYNLSRQEIGKILMITMPSLGDEIGDVFLTSIFHKKF